MPRSLPSPVAAAIGLVPATLDGVKRLPVKAVQLPILALSSALNTVDVLRREYDDLAERGERLVARLRGEVVDRADEIEDRVGDLVGGVGATGSRAADSAARAAGSAAEGAAEGLAGANGRLQDALGSVSSFAPDRDEVKDAVSAPAGFASTPSSTTGSTPSSAPSSTPSTTPSSTPSTTPGDPTPAVRSDPEAPKGVPTPKATEPDSTRVDTAASPSVVAAVEQAVEAVEAASTGPAPTHGELPLPDYDHMTLGSLRGRMRSLSVEQLFEVRAYEKAHADRLPIVTMLDNRIAKLSADAAPTAAAGSPSAASTPASPA